MLRPISTVLLSIVALVAAAGDAADDAANDAAAALNKAPREITQVFTP